jgi:hypothetical protein
VKKIEDMMLRELVNICEHGLIDEEDGRFILNSRQLAWKEVERRLPEIEAAGELAESVIDDDDAKIAHPARRIVTTTAVQACIAAYRAARRKDV